MQAGRIAQPEAVDLRGHLRRVLELPGQTLPAQDAVGERVPDELTDHFGARGWTDLDGVGPIALVGIGQDEQLPQRQTALLPAYVVDAERALRRQRIQHGAFIDAVEKPAG